MSRADVVVKGSVAQGFGRVHDAFRANFTERGELGAAVAGFHRGELVVDLWAGWMEEGRREPWRRDTLTLCYSTTKPFAAACVLVLADRGAVHLDDPVARLWPAFATGGKHTVTIRQLLSHQAGLVVLEEEVPAETLLDWDATVALLERQTPNWPPGTAHGEHAIFYGHLVGELVRRTDGRSLGSFFREEIAQPWGLDFHIGLRGHDVDRAARTCGMTSDWVGQVAGEPGSFKFRALANPPTMLDPAWVNSDAWRRAEVPAVNGYTTALAVARFYEGVLSGGVLDGRTVLSPQMCAEATSAQAYGPDRVFEEDLAWGLGFNVEGATFGHGGLGGSFGYAHRELELTFSYVTNLMRNFDRAEAAMDAAEACARALA